MEVSNILLLILLGAVLGILGQGIRIIVGLKKQSDEAAKEGKKLSDMLDIKRMGVSLLISVVVGAVAGSLGMLQQYSVQMVISKELIITLLAVGYAGTDFIEGFIRTAPRK